MVQVVFFLFVSIFLGENLKIVSSELANKLSVLRTPKGRLRLATIVMIDLSRHGLHQGLLVIEVAGFEYLLTLGSKRSTIPPVWG